MKLAAGSVKVDRQSEAARRRTEMEEDQQEALADLMHSWALRESVKATPSVRCAELTAQVVFCTHCQLSVLLLVVGRTRRQDTGEAWSGSG